MEVKKADAAWERIGRTPGNLFDYTPPRGGGIAEYTFRVHAQLGSAASPPSDAATARVAPPPPPGGGVSGAGSGP